MGKQWVGSWLAGGDVVMKQEIQEFREWCVKHFGIPR